MLTGETKFFIAVLFFTALIISVAVYLVLQPPQAIPNLDRTTAQRLGPATARVTLVEFSDYQCPACKTVSPELKKLLAKYPSSLQLVLRHYPLPQHTLALELAKSAEAAGMQGKFWEMHDLIFERQATMSAKGIVEMAADLKLDLDSFEKDRRSKQVEEKIALDKVDALRAGVNSTPTFFINGYPLQFRSIDDIDIAIEKQLTK